MDVQQQAVQIEPEYIEEVKQEETLPSERLIDKIEEEIPADKADNLKNIVIQNVLEPVMSTFAYPSSNWGFNYQVDRKNTSMSYLQDNYNNFVDHVAGRINELQADINAVDTSLTWWKGEIQDNSSRITANYNRIISVAAAVDAVQTSLNWWKVEIQDNTTAIQKNSFEDTKTNNRIDTVVGRIADTNTSLDYWKLEIQKNATAIDSNRIGDNKTNVRIDTVVDRIADTNTSLDYWKLEIQKNATAIDSNRIGDNKTNVRIDTVVDRIAETNTSLDYWKLEIQKNATAIDSNNVGDNKTNARIDTVVDRVNVADGLMTASILALDSRVSSLENSLLEELVLMHATLKGLKNYDDTSFKNSVNQRFVDYFNSTSYESGISTGDGIFTKVIKGQFTRLIAELNRQLTLSLTATTNNIEFFKTYLREEFSLLNDWHSLQVDWSKMINSNILVAIAALDKISLKPTGDVNVSVPAFDFDRLQEILEALSFGNVVNEAGTNLWDVLKELIETLGGVVEAVVKIVPDLIKELIDLIIPENPNFFSEDVEALTSAFDTKFEWAFNLNSSFRSVFSQPKSLKSLSVPINGKNYKVVPDVVDLNMIKTIFTGYFCFLTLFTSYKRIVGGGDVIQ